MIGHVTSPQHAFKMAALRDMHTKQEQLLRLPTLGKTYYFRVDYYVFPLGGRRIVFVLIIIFLILVSPHFRSVNSNF